MPEADVIAWRAQFEEPDAAELAGRDLPRSPSGWPNWLAWALDRWPSLTDDYL